ncbi:unnamed protein product [Blepharisma stoltei]|uniref:AAA+ ATPase domain-containing protein n=1 Tax=Blepharisma stoltei TaxID=1481888 RepID=A0AAU9J5J6_9CILI|nr:unnamed protein product [Blepharisma stoltei]
MENDSLLKRICNIDQSTLSGAYQKLCLSDKYAPDISYIDFSALRPLISANKSEKKFSVPPFQNPMFLKSTVKIQEPPKENIKNAQNMIINNALKPRQELLVKQEQRSNQKPLAQQPTKTKIDCNWNPIGYRYKRKKEADPEEDEEKPGFMTAKDFYKTNQFSNQQAHPKFSNSPEQPEPQQRFRSTGLVKPFACPLKTGNNSNNNQAKPQEESNKLTGIEDKLIEIIESEIISRDPGVKWNDIAGLQFAKKAVHEAIVWPLQRPDLFKGLRAPPKGLLLFGPPGTGKTMIGKAIASEANATFFSISASSITSKWVGEGEKLVKVLFSLAVKYQPTVIFIDEIDSLLSARNDSEQEGSRKIKTEFLVQIDGAATNPDDRILLIGATNRPNDLDEAVRRRLAKRMYIPLPNSEGRKQLIVNLMQSISNSLSESDINVVVERSKGYSGSDLKNLCTEASMNPLRSLTDIMNIDATIIPPVSLHDFEFALTIVKPSVSQKDITFLLDWNEQFGSFQFNMEELDT